MKKIICVAFVLVSVCFASCSSDDNGGGEPNEPNPPAPQTGFFYAENGATTMQTVDHPYANATYKSIFAQQGGSTVVEINLSSLDAGTYAIGSSNAFTYLKAGGMWIASAGSVTITENAGGKLTGTFEMTAGSGITGVDSVEGTFTDITVNP